MSFDYIEHGEYVPTNISDEHKKHLDEDFNHLEYRPIGWGCINPRMTMEAKFYEVGKEVNIRTRTNINRGIFDIADGDNTRYIREVIDEIDDYYENPINFREIEELLEGVGDRCLFWSVKDHGRYMLFTYSGKSIDLMADRISLGSFIGFKLSPILQVSLEENNWSTKEVRCLVNLVLFVDEIIFPTDAVGLLIELEVVINMDKKEKENVEEMIENDEYYIVVEI